MSRCKNLIDKLSILEGDSKEVIKLKALGKKAKLLSNRDNIEGLDKDISKIAKQAIKLDTTYFTPDELKVVTDIANGKWKGSGFGQIGIESAVKLASIIGESLVKNEAMKKFKSIDMSKFNKQELDRINNFKNNGFTIIELDTDKLSGKAHYKGNEFGFSLGGENLYIDFGDSGFYVKGGEDELLKSMLPMFKVIANYGGMRK